MNIAIALIVGLLLALPAHAQTLGGDQEKSLRDAVEQAWSRHPQAAAIAAREAEARARAEVAAGITPGPASMSLSNLNDRLNHNRGKQEWEVELAAPLWLPGQKAARQTEAESAVGEVAARRASLRLQIAGEVREAWWAVAGARNVRDLAGRRSATARALEADVVRRFKAGDLARVDANLAQNERLAAEAELLETEAALRQAEQSYRGLTGNAAPAALPTENAIALRERNEDHAQLVVLAAAAQLARARLKVTEETRRDAPELALRVVRDRDVFGEPHTNTVGVKLTIPFSSGARVRQESSAARAEALQADAELALARQKIELEAERTRLDFDIAQRQLAMAEERRALTAENLRLAEKSFSLGESDLTALLRTRGNAFEAEAFLNRQQVARAAAQSRLKQALGVLP